MPYENNGLRWKVTILVNIKKLNLRMWVTLIWFRIRPPEDHHENSEGFFTILRKKHILLLNKRQHLQ